MLLFSFYSIQCQTFIFLNNISIVCMCVPTRSTIAPISRSFLYPCARAQAVSSFCILKRFPCKNMYYLIIFFLFFLIFFIVFNVWTFRVAYFLVPRRFSRYLFRASFSLFGFSLRLVWRVYWLVSLVYISALPLPFAYTILTEIENMLEDLYFRQRAQHICLYYSFG